MEIRKAWVVYTTSDTGRTDKVVAIVDFDKPDLANSISIDKGAWGGNGYVTERNIMRFGDIAIIVSHETPKPVFMNVDLLVDEATKRKNALAKLTKEDKRILGIKD